MFVLNNINQNLYKCYLNLDLSKTCNTVDSDIFLNKKYCKFEICGKPLDLLTSYEINTLMYVTSRLQKSIIMQSIPGILNWLAICCIAP